MDVVERDSEGSEVMPARFSNTERWDQKWFRSLPPDAKLLFLHMNARCDVAGFFEWDEDRIGFETGLTTKRIQGAVEPLLSRIADNGQRLWLPEFIGEQRNFPLNPENNSHKGIIRLLEERLSFDPRVGLILSGEGLPNPYEGAHEGLFNPPSKGRGLVKVKIEIEEWFKIFWKIYPKKRGKGAAEKSFAKAVTSQAIYDAVMVGLEKHLGCADWEKEGGQFIPNPATWLNQKRWEDEPEAGKKGQFGTARGKAYYLRKEANDE